MAHSFTRYYWSTNWVLQHSGHLISSYLLIIAEGFIHAEKKVNPRCFDGDVNINPALHSRIIFITLSIPALRRAYNEVRVEFVLKVPGSIELLIYYHIYEQLSPAVSASLTWNLNGITVGKHNNVYVSITI